MDSSPSDNSQTTRRRRALRFISRSKSDKQTKDKLQNREQYEKSPIMQCHRHVVTPFQCLSSYVVLLLFYTAVLLIVFLTRRSKNIVSSLPDLTIGETKSGIFNPYTAQKHLEALTTIPHPFNSHANTDITKKYLRDQFRALQEEAIELGRRNVRFDDGSVDNSTWVSRSVPDDENVEGGEGLLEEEEMQVVQGDNMVMWIGGVVQSKEGQVVPVSVEVDINQENQTALLISAHFDSVSTSYGATDDGGGVSVALTLMRHLLYHPVEHTVIFNINNAEEDGTLGSIAFMGASPNSTTETGIGHPWKKYVKAFINLEGAGSGGPAVVFRASNSEIVRQYASHSPFPHASVFANDAFKLRLIDSETDYSIYTQHNLPGLDIAFYQRRSMYHSTTDYLPIESLYHMGSNVQATITGLCNSPYLDHISIKTDDDPSSSSSSSSSSLRNKLSGKSIFYDIFGRYMVETELWTAFLVNILVLGLGLPILGAVTVFAGRAIRRRRMRRHVSVPISSTSEYGMNTLQRHGGIDSPTPSLICEPSNDQRAADTVIAPRACEDVPGPLAVLRTLGFVFLVVALDLVAVFAAAKWQWFVNPLARHSQQWLVLAFFGIWLVFINTLAVWLFTFIESRVSGGPLPIGRGFSQWVIALGLWWWLVVIAVGSGVAGWAGVGAFYGTTILAVCSGGAALIQIIFDFFAAQNDADSSTKGAGLGIGRRFGWIVVLAVALLVPGVILSDLTVLVAHMISQSLTASDGGKMYLIYGALSIPLTLLTLPVISRSRNFKLTLLIQVITLIPIIWILAKADPFSATDPASIYFSQYYNHTTNTSFVDLQMEGGPGYIHKLVQDVPTLVQLGGSARACTPVPIEGDLEELCRFVPPARQVFEVAPVRVDWISKPTVVGSDGWRKGQIQIQALDSRSCSVRLPQTTAGHETQVWLDQTNVPPLSVNHRPKLLNVYLRDWNHPWTVHVRVKDTSSLPVLGPGDQNPSAYSVRFQVVCGYDDWSSRKGYAAIYNDISDHLPIWGRMKGASGQGLFRVGVDVVF